MLEQDQTVNSIEESEMSEGKDGNLRDSREIKKGDIKMSWST